VVDEAHHTTAGTWAKVIAHFSCRQAARRNRYPNHAVTAAALGEHYQAMVQGPTAAELTSEGYLAPARVLAPPGFDSAGLRKRMGDFDTKQAEQRVGTIMGDCLGHYRKHLSGQTAIAFCCSVAHAEAVAHLFQSAGIAAASIDGTMDTSTRRELLADLGTGRLKVLTSCALIGEGVDVPSVGGCILLRPTASVALHLQMIGRCLRPQPGKTAVVLDHVGNTLRLGHHLEERDWTLDGLRKRDREAAPSVKVCPTCFATSPSTAQICRDCGHVFAPPERRELRQVEGELQELTVKNNKIKCNDIVQVRCKWFAENGQHLKDSWLDDWKVYSIEEDSASGKWVVVGFTCIAPDGSKQKVLPCDIRHDPNAAKREQGKATDLEALRELAQQRGYKRGWAERVHQARLAKRHGI
jgi:DNA repair protein RadD